jgi:hypothetical protein
MLRSVATTSLNVPSGFVPVIDQFGTIVDPAHGRYRMEGQASLAFSYFVRATHHEVPAGNPLDRHNLLAINSHWPNYLMPIQEHLVGVVNGWAENSEDVQINVGGLMVQMFPSRFTQGAAGYLALFAGVNPPMHVVRALNILIIVEGAPPAGFTVAQIAALNALQVYVFNWGTTQMAEACDRYATHVQMKIEGAMSTVCNMVPVTVMKDSGTMAQLVMKMTPYAAVAPVALPGELLVFGWMLAKEDLSVVINKKVIMLNGQLTSQSEIGEYINKMIKS